MTTEKSDAMKSILAAFSGYPQSLIHSYKDRIFLTESGMGTLGTVVGFIASLWLTGQHEKANCYADDFVKWLNYICPLHPVEHNIGGRTLSVPGRVCELHSDGTMMGFSVCWFLYHPDQTSTKELEKRRERRFGTWEAKYAYQMNGGLLFHGSNQEVFATTLPGQTSLWSIHT